MEISTFVIFHRSYLTKRVPAPGVLDIPFQFTDRRDTRAFLDGNIGMVLRRDIAHRIRGPRLLGQRPA
jgi:TRAP-type C4-dicarboxylate transport system substrate-binding protein